MAATSAAYATGFLLVLYLASVTSARPCKTVFYFSTATAFYPYDALPGNPNSRFLIRSYGPGDLTLIFSSTGARFPGPLSISTDFNSIIDDVSRISLIEKSSALPAQIHPSISSSIRDRSGDIVSVVGALLFGVGCGGLTAAIMYFVWAVFSPSRLHSGDADSSEDDEVNYVKKNLGYSMIPSQPKVAGDDLKKTGAAV